MLPKPEKIRKTKAEQLDLVRGIDENLKSRRKSTVLIFALFLTIGLSLGLWTYRRLTVILANPISFHLPVISFPDQPIPSSSPRPIDLNPTISPIISNQPGRWSFLVLRNGQTIWQSGNPLVIPTGKLTPSQPLVSSSLPEGLKVTENITQTPDSLQDIINIDLPNQQLTFLIDLSQTSDPATARVLFPRLASAIYWAVI